MTSSAEVLRDVLAPGLCLVVCGTAAGAASAARGHYYAGPGNRFWRTLKAIGLIPGDFDPTGERKLLDHWIGLTDLVKRAFGGDRSLPAVGWDVDGFKANLKKYRPLVVAFNGKKAARMFYRQKDIGYGAQPPHPDFPGIVFFVATSTSGSASRWWAANPGLWQELAVVVKAVEPRSGRKERRGDDTD